MYAAKEAVMIREHDPQAEVHIFMMDMRSFSKGYEGYYQQAREKYEIQYTRCRISDIREDPKSNNLILRYTDDQAAALSAPREGLIPIPLLNITEEQFDLVVLSVGMEISESVQDLGRRLGLELDQYGFCSTPMFNPLETTRPGVFAVGPFREPKDIPESVVDASGAAGRAAGLLAPARGLLSRTAEFPPEREVVDEEPRIGVFVCHCGSNIGGFLDVPHVADYARTLPNVVHTEDNLYTCSQDSIATITERVKELNLNRVVVASCTPLTHAPLFRDSIRSAGLNPALFEMANIRNQCSWVHSHDWEAATEKARELVSMAVARAATLQPLVTTEIDIEHDVLVVGGGVAGMTAALSLAEGGFEVHLVERESRLGGNLHKIYSGMGDEDPRTFLEELIQRAEEQPLIHQYLSHEIAETHGFKGRFRTVLQGKQADRVEIHHGATILATGAKEYRGAEFGYAESSVVVTGFDFAAILASADGQNVALEGRAKEAWLSLQERLPDEIAMILCVGPADQFCGRICCSTALKNALELKRLKPDARVTVLYKDIRTYGAKESLYTQAREAGIVFIRYQDPPVVQDGLRIEVVDPNLGIPVAIKPDLLVLSTPAVPSDGSAQLASQFKVPVDGDGFFLEAHVKLRPVDFSTEGIFMAGMAHYPKMIDESIVQAQAAAARAARLLSRSKFTVGGSVAQVDPTICVGCLTCVRSCPFGVPQVSDEYLGVADIVGAAFIESTICRGCGTCVAECPANAIQLAHYQDDQIMVKLDALLARI
jgi:heterodisulfide reductase subunit A